MSGLYWCKVTITTTYEVEVEATTEVQASFKAGMTYLQDGKRSGPDMQIEVIEVK